MLAAGSRSLPSEADRSRALLQFFSATIAVWCGTTSALVSHHLPLNWPVPGAMAKRLAELQLKAVQQDPLGFQNRLRRAIRQLLLAKAARAGEVLKLLSIHRRTLNRRLEAQGTTFQKMLEATRSELAQLVRE
jgi:hypothetical protein